MTDDLALTDVAALARDLAGGGARVLIGLVGPPGVGKSTAAELLVADLRGRGTSTCLVPMDGFHLDQRELERLGTAERKGAPDTFDVAGYAALLRRLRDREPLTYAPRFDRDLEQSVGSALPVAADVDVVVTEGNYLLLDGPSGAEAAWGGVHGLLDRCFYVEVPEALRLERLIARHVAHGRSPEAAREWVERNDEANARLVASTRARADGVVQLG